MSDPNVQTSTSDFPLSLPAWWDENLLHDAVHEAFFPKFEGREGSMMGIVTKKDFLTKPGKTMHLTTLTALRNAGVTGHTELEGSEGEFQEGQFDLTVNWLRNAVATDKKTDKEVFWDWTNNARKLLSEWLARYTDWNMFDQLINTETTQKQLYANNQTAATALTTTDTFGPREIRVIRLALQRLGAKPLKIYKKNGQSYPQYAIVMSEADEFYLKSNTVFYEALKDSLPRGEDNPIFEGCLGQYDGCLLYVHRGLAGDFGTPLRPETSISGSHGAADTTLTVATSGSTNAQTTFFPSTGTLKIYKQSTNTYEFVTYSGKTATTFTGVTRGASYGGDSGSGAQTYVTGDIITLQNSVSRVIGFGAEFAARGWGKMPTGTTNVRDYGFKFGVGVESVFGQAAIKKQNGNVRGYVIMNTYAETPQRNI